MNKPLRIGIIGTRGIPNRYGGFEACAEEIGRRLAGKGHDVAVYCGNDHPVADQQWQGIKRIIIKNPEHNLGTSGQFIYDLLCNIDSRRRDFNVVLHLGYTSDSIWFWLWTGKARHIVNMDGLEWRREKYGRLTKGFLKIAEYLATIRASRLIADNKGIEDYLRGKYRKNISCIPYGAEIPSKIDDEVIQRFGFRKNGFDLIIARAEPENQIEMAIRAKTKTNDHIPLLVVSNRNNYLSYLERKFKDRTTVIFHGPEYDRSVLDALRQNARYYIHGHSVGGTNPSLLEAMACGCFLVIHDNPFNRAVCGDHAFYFATDQELIDQLCKQPAAELVNWKKANINKIRNIYNWEFVTNAYEEVFINSFGN